MWRQKASKVWEKGDIVEGESLSTGTQKLQAVTYSKSITKVQKPSFFLPGDRLLTGNQASGFPEWIETLSVVDAMS